MPDRRNASEWLRYDPSWKYVNIRRLYAYIEHSIDHSLQWVVFEPNGEATWRQARGGVLREGRPLHVDLPGR